MSSTNSPEAMLKGLESVVSNDAVAHVWRSGTTGVLMNMVFTETGVALESTGSGQGEEIDQFYETYYAGTMSREEATEHRYKLIGARY